MDILREDGKVAITYGDEKITYMELKKSILALSGKLKIKDGEPVGIYLENSPSWVYSLFAIWNSGGVAVPIDFDSSEEQIDNILKLTGMNTVLTSVSGEKRFWERNKIKGIGCEVIGNLQTERVQLEKLRIPKGEEEALILFTSGTSGKSKGVVLAGRSLFCNVKDYFELGMVSESDVISAFLPLHHAFPLNATCLTPLYLGATMAMSRGVTGEDLKEVFAKNKLTMIVAVPRVFIALHKGIMSRIRSNKVINFIFKLAEKVDNYKFRRILFSSLHKKFGGNIRVCISGGAKLDKELWKDFETLAFPMVEGYGLSETSPALTGNTIGKRRIGTVGCALGHVELKVEEGELLARGDVVMKEYYKNPEATREAIDEEGWFHTGDLAEIDQEGYVTITGRKNSLIVLSNGKNINPEPLEKLLVSESEYIEEGVITTHKDLLKVIIELKPLALGLANIEEKIQKELDEFNKKVKSYEAVRGFAIAKEPLPKTPIGKIKRYMVRYPEKVEAIEERDVELPKDEAFEKLYEFMVSVTGKKINPDKRFERDLAMDSLDILELKAHIEKYFDMELTEEFFIENNTIIGVYEKVKDKYLGGKTKIKKHKKIEFKERSGRYHNLASTLLTPILRQRFGFKGEFDLDDRPSIFISNHQSYLDSILINSALPKEIRRKTYYIAKKKHFENTAMKYIAKRGNIILVDYSKVEELMELAKEIVRRGNNLVIFPEGTRSKDGRPDGFKSSFAHVARETGARVVMIGIRGAFEAWGPDKRYPVKHKIDVEIIDRTMIGEDIDREVERVEGIYAEWLAKYE